MTQDLLAAALIMLAAFGTVCVVGLRAAARARRITRLAAAATAAHLGAREPVLATDQIVELIAQHQLPCSSRDLAAAHGAWREAAEFFGTDPALLRPTDDLVALAAARKQALGRGGFLAAPMITGEPRERIARMRLPLELEMHASWRFIDEVEHLAWRDPRSDACSGCHYPLAGLAPETTRCPECGRHPVGSLSTLGAYTLFVAGIAPPRKPAA
jgi:hypothetical protein